ncbi:MAG: hypothetical protein ABL921_22060 [Pirellula sp.]
MPMITALNALCFYQDIFLKMHSSFGTQRCVVLRSYSLFLYEGLPNPTWKRRQRTGDVRSTKDLSFDKTLTLRPY